MNHPLIIETRLRQFGTYLREMRDVGDEVLIDFWTAEVDRLLDDKLQLRERQADAVSAPAFAV